MGRRRRARRAYAQKQAGPIAAPSNEKTEILRRRARRATRKGDHRKAAVALRELVALEGDAKSWTLLGDTLKRARRPREAIRALKQACWLHRQAGADLRARTVARMLVELDPFDEKHAHIA
jgi:hypothetical protein